VALGEAYKSGDVEALEDLIAERYSHINNGAPPIGRKIWLDANRERAKKIKDGSIEVTDYQLADLRITLIGESAAVVTGRVHAAETVDGKPRQYNVRFTNFWVKEDGRWKRAAFHDSPVRD
jgi:ketosteroid isomerase-like protein